MPAATPTMLSLTLLLVRAYALSQGAGVEEGCAGRGVSAIPVRSGGCGVPSPFVVDQGAAGMMSFLSPSVARPLAEAPSGVLPRSSPSLYPRRPPRRTAHNGPYKIVRKSHPTPSARRVGPGQSQAFPSLRSSSHLFKHIRDMGGLTNLCRRIKGFGFGNQACPERASSLKTYPTVPRGLASGLLCS